MTPSRRSKSLRLAAKSCEYVTSKELQPPTLPAEHPYLLSAYFTPIPLWCSLNWKDIIILSKMSCPSVDTIHNVIVTFSTVPLRPLVK